MSWSWLFPEHYDTRGEPGLAGEMAAKKTPVQEKSFIGVSVLTVTSQMAGTSHKVLRVPSFQARMKQEPQTDLPSSGPQPTPTHHPHFRNRFTGHRERGYKGVAEAVA